MKRDVILSIVFDGLISGYYGVDGFNDMCGGAETFSSAKVGLQLRRSNYQYMARPKFSDLKVGDSLGYWNDDTDRGHVNMVGEVYNDRIVLYDFGIFPGGRNFKVVLPKTRSDSYEEALKILQGRYGSGLVANYQATRKWTFIKE